LAWKNVEHWQHSSQRNNLLYFNGASIIVGSNLRQETCEKPIALGAGSQILSTGDAKVSFAESGGAPLTAMKEKDDELRDEMRSLGNQPLLRVKGGAKTASGEAISEEETQSAAQSWAEALEWCIYECYQMAAQWNSETLADDFDIAIFRDFGLVARSQQDLTIIDAARARKDMSKDLWLRELRARETLVTIVDDQDIEDEITRLSEEQQSLADMFPPPAAQQPPAPPPAADKTTAAA
jgi:hypothetical protein